jgi:folate-dependent phosphoribosylglycinamide formyltransferase PurN
MRRDEAHDASGGAGRLRVVVFTGGAVLEDDCLAFIARLEAEPAIELVGVFCESAATGFSGVIGDLWARRRWLAPPLLAARALRRIVRSVAAPAREADRRRTLRRLGARLHVVADMHARSVLSRIAELKPDLGAVYGGPILRPELFRMPVHGTLGIHHGRLPDYRGKKTTFWAIYNNEDSVGVAIQRIGAGLDRGDLLRDAVLPVGRSPLPRVVRRLERLGLDLYLEAVLSIHQRTAVFRPQPAGGVLYKDPRGGDIARFWLKDLRRIVGRRRHARSLSR